MTLKDIYTIKDIRSFTSSLLNLTISKFISNLKIFHIIVTFT